MPDEEERRFGNYVLVRQIGQGGMGAVWHARDEATGLDVALKILSVGIATNEEYTRRFLTEARLASQLNHPNIVRVHDYGRKRGHYYLAMGYVDGEDCKARIARHARLRWREAVDITAQVAEGLHAADKEGVIHRDIKPENILIDREGHVRITDLGLAKEVDVVTPMPSDTSLGTPDYMSPEQVNNSETVDFRSDIYSLGATLFHMVCGKAPYTGYSAYEVMVKHVAADLPSPRKYVPKLPTPVCDVMRKMMAARPSDRYGSYDELLADLRALQKGKRVAARGFHDESLLGANGNGNHARKSRKKLALAAAIAVPILSAIALIVYFLAT